MPGKDPASTPGGQGNDYLQRAYALSGVGAARDLYNDWANKYDADLSSLDYASPQAAVDALGTHLPADRGGKSATLQILDAGCGTGMVGQCLKQSLGSTTKFEVDGVDLTPGMLEVARTKDIYRELWPADLNEKLESADDKYDAVLCVGTLTKGHVGPKCLVEFARVTKAGGLVIATIHDEIWESHGYKAEAESLGEKGVVEVVSTADFGIIKGETSGGRMLVLKKK